jgi:hypothetical protein
MPLGDVEREQSDRNQACHPVAYIRIRNPIQLEWEAARPDDGDSAVEPPIVIALHHQAVKQPFLIARKLR